METFTIQSDDKKKIDLLKKLFKAMDLEFESRKESPYDPEFVKKIKKSEEEFKTGQYKEVKTLDLWK